MPTDIDEPVLQMWGTPNQLQAARQDLHALLEHVQIEIQAGIRRVGGWVKIKAMPTDTRQMMIDKMINDSKIRKMYRRPPPEGMAFPAVGLFVWPVKELNPQVSLGMTLEALDDIRFEEEVFIIYSRNRNLFRVLGEKNTNVESAVERIYGAFCEVATKNRKPTKMCLVSPPSIRLPAIKVYVDENHDLINRQVTVKRIDENKGIQVFLGGPRPNHRFLEIWRIKGEILRKANLEYLRKALQQGLLDVAYYRGQARLKVYIGKLVLFGYRRASLKDGTYELQDFSEMVRNPQTDGEVIRSIGSTKYNIRDNETAEALVEYLGDRYDLFPAKDHSPDSPHGQTRSLEPHISATFDLRLYDQASSEDIRLEVEFERLPKMKTYKAVNFRWLETERKGKENCRKSPLDVKIMDLEANLAYQIDMSTWALYEGVSIYPIFQEFRRRLSVEEIPDEFCGLPPPPPGRADDRPRVLRVSFVNLPGLSVGGLVQKTKFRYWMGNTDYVFEITKYENLPIHEVSSLYPDSVPISYKGLETPFDTRWGCGLWNSGWDEKLSKQASAKIGTRGNWEPDVDKFFLPTAAGKLNACGGVWGDDGVAEFVGRIEEAVELVKRAQENAALKKQKTNPYASMVDAALLSRMYTATSGSEAEQWIGSAEFDE